MNTQTTISQDQLRAIHNCLTEAARHIKDGSYLDQELDIALKACAQMGHELHQAWTDLPDGTPLKEIYRDEMWHPEPEPTNDYDPEGRGGESSESTNQPGSGEGISNSDQPSKRGPRRQGH